MGNNGRFIILCYLLADEFETSMSKAEEVKAIIKATVVVLDFDQVFVKKWKLNIGRKKKKELRQNGTG